MVSAGMSAPTIICPKCGKQLGPNIRFCGMCGTPIAAPTGDAATSGTAPTPALGSAAVTSRGAAARTPARTTAGTGRTTAKMQPLTKEAAAKIVGPNAPTQAASPAESALAAPAPDDGEGLTIPAPPKPADAASGAPSSGDIPKPPSSRSEFQRLLEEVETGFESIVTPEPADPNPARPRPKPSDPTGEIPHDMTEARALFDAMVVEHARPIRDFMIEVRLGEPLRAWVEFCLPALRTILRSAKGMGIGEFVSKLQSFMQAVEFTQSGNDRLVRGQVRQAIIDTYSELTAYLPAAFALEQEANRRESVIVHSLLQQVPGLHKVSTDRIYAAGLTSLALFYVARPGDIAELTGIPMELAQSVVARFRDYRKKTESLSPEGNRIAELQVLSELSSTLERVVSEYDGQPPGNVGDAKRRELRRVRADAMIEIGLVLARLGEVERLRELEKLPFGARAASIRVFVSETQKREPRGSGF